jgi:hypothetical protein
LRPEEVDESLDAFFRVGRKLAGYLAETYETQLEDVFERADYQLFLAAVMVKLCAA